MRASWSCPGHFAKYRRPANPNRFASAADRDSAKKALPRWPSRNSGSARWTSAARKPSPNSGCASGGSTVGHNRSEPKPKHSTGALADYCTVGIPGAEFSIATVCACKWCTYTMAWWSKALCQAKHNYRPKICASEPLLQEWLQRSVSVLLERKNCRDQISAQVSL